MVKKFFKDDVGPVIARGVIVYAGRRYRAGEDVAAVNPKERKQLLDMALAAEPNSDTGRRLKAKYEEWRKQSAAKQPAVNVEEEQKKAAAEDEAKKKKALAEEEAKKQEEARKKAAEDRQSRGRGGQSNKQQEQFTPHTAGQALGNIPPMLRPAVGGLPPAVTTDNNQGGTPRSETNEKKE